MILRNLCLVNLYLQNAYGLLSWFSENITVLRSMQAHLIKASLWWDEFQEKSAS